MTRRIIKPFLISALFLFILSGSVLASAAGNKGLSIKSGESKLVVTGIQLGDDGRTYAPYDILFNALGATSSYDADSGTVTAQSGDVTVSFGLDQDSMTVTTDEFTNDFSIYAQAYKDSATGKVYVPVRYAAQALGYVVEWDSANQEICLESIDGLIADSGATYTVLDKYMAYQKKLAAQPRAVAGTFKMNMDVASDDGSNTLTADGSVSGIVDDGNTEMNFKMTSNASDFISAIYGEETQDVQTTMVLSMLENLDINLIVNGDTGMIYVQAPAITSLLGVSEETWLSIDLSALYADTSLNSMSFTNSYNGDFKDYLSFLLKYQCLNEHGWTESSVTSELDAINAIVSDQVFVQSGDSYVSTYTYSEDGQSLTLKITLSFNGDAVTGSVVDFTMDMGEDGSVTASLTADSTGSEVLKLKLEIPDSLTMDLSAEFTYTGTTQTPADAPPSDSTVMPIDSLFGETE